MSSLRILSLPLGNHDGKELLIVTDLEKSRGYVTALQDVDSAGNGLKRHRSAHATVRESVVAAIQLYDDFMAKKVE